MGFVRAEGVRIRDNRTGQTRELKITAMFFAIGHAPATKFLNGQLELDEAGYIKTTPGSATTSVKGKTRGRLVG